MRRIIVFSVLPALFFCSTARAQKKTLEFAFGAGISHLNKPQPHPDPWKLGLNFGGSAGGYVSNHVLLGVRFAYNWFGVDSRTGFGLAIAELLPIIKHYTRSIDSNINFYTTAGLGAVTIAESFRFVEDGDNRTTALGSGRYGLMFTAGLGITLTLGKTIRKIFIEGRVSWRGNPDTRFWPITMGVIF